LIYGVHSRTTMLELSAPLPRAVGIAFLGLRSHFGEGGGDVRQVKPALAIIAKKGLSVRHRGIQGAKKGNSS